MLDSGTNANIGKGGGAAMSRRIDLGPALPGPIWNDASPWVWFVHWLRSGKDHQVNDGVIGEAIAGSAVASLPSKGREVSLGDHGQ